MSADSDNPFAALAGLRASLPPGEIKPDPVTIPKAPPTPNRAVVRLEKKGRRGKTVTAIEKLGLDDGELQAWLKSMKKSLGCGGAVEGDRLILQGDCRDRAVKWLEGRGIKKISR